MSIRSLMLASVTALIMTSFGAQAAPLASSPTAGARQGVALQLAADATEFGARRRHRAYRGNSAAGLAMMGVMIGTIGAAVAAERRRDAYKRSYYAPYGHGYGYGHAQPYGYGHPHVYHNPSALPAGPLYPGQHRQPRIGW
jgi:hypothetical protein